jgi:hypothetical protein
MQENDRPNQRTKPLFNAHAGRDHHEDFSKSLTPESIQEAYKVQQILKSL